MFKRLDFGEWADGFAQLSFWLTFLVFLLILIRVLRMRKKDVKHMSHLPLEDDDPERPDEVGTPDSKKDPS